MTGRRILSPTPPFLVWLVLGVGLLSLLVVVVGSAWLMLDAMIQHYCDVAGDGSGSLWTHPSQSSRQREP